MRSSFSSLYNYVLFVSFVETLIIITLEMLRHTVKKDQFVAFRVPIASSFADADIDATEEVFISLNIHIQFRPAFVMRDGCGR